MKYFVAYTESHGEEEGSFFAEVDPDTGEITRHMTISSGVLYWATPDEWRNDEYMFTDQPEFRRAEYDAEIDRAQFEALWTQALAQAPSR